MIRRLRMMSLPTKNECLTKTSEPNHHLNKHDGGKERFF